MAKIEVLKTVYLARHGESEDNTKPVFQSVDSPLSERGREQAERLAERASRIEFDALISSPYARAKETAEAVSKITGKEAERSRLFTERIKPSSIDGKPHSDPVAKEIAKRWNESLLEGGFKVEDGESYEEIVSRADEALSYLEKRPEQSLFVITHGFFLRTLALRVILGDSMTQDNLKRFNSATAIKNTGITVLQYSKWSEEKEPKWRFWIYNDHSHLG